MSGHQIDTLPADLLLGADGHLSDVGVAVLADGERALVPGEVRAHGDACPSCCRRVGAEAMLSATLGDALRAAPTPTPVPAATGVTTPAKISGWRPARTFPAPMIAAAMVAAFVGIVPTLMSARSWMVTLSHLAGVTAKTAWVLARHDGRVAGPMAVVLPCASAAMLTLLGWMLARRLPPVALEARGVRQ